MAEGAYEASRRALNDELGGNNLSNDPANDAIGNNNLNEHDDYYNP